MDLCVFLGYFILLEFLKARNWNSEMLIWKYDHLKVILETSQVFEVPRHPGSQNLLGKGQALGGSVERTIRAFQTPKMTWSFTFSEWSNGCGESLGGQRRFNSFLQQEETGTCHFEAPIFSTGYMASPSMRKRKYRRQLLDVKIRKGAYIFCARLLFLCTHFFCLAAQQVVLQVLFFSIPTYFSHKN